MAGCFRYSRRSVSAAFFLTNALEALSCVSSTVDPVPRDLRGDEQPVDLCTQCLSQLLATDVRDRVQRQAVVELIVVQQVLPDAVNDQVQQFVFFVEE